MEIRFTSEEEAGLSRIASTSGVNTESLVKEAALRLLDEDSRVRAAIREGVAQADQGKLIEEREMEARLERMLRP